MFDLSALFFRTRPRDHIAYPNYSLVLNKFSRVDFLLRRFSSFHVYVYMFCSSSNIQTFYFWRIFYLFLCKNQLKPPHCSPILFYSRGSIKTNLNLNYIGMLPRKFQLFQPIKVVFEKMFYIPMTLCKNISASYTHTHINMQI